MDDSRTEDLSEYFVFLTAEEKAEYDIERPALSYRKYVWKRFKANGKIALFSSLVIIGIVLLSIVIPEISSFDYDTWDLANRNLLPSQTHWLGTDHLGRDMFVRLFLGIRNSFIIAFVTGLISLCIGILYGGIAGFSDAKIGVAMIKILDILGLLPASIYVILFMLLMNTSLSGSNMLTLMLAFCMTFWVNIAKIIREEILHIKNHEFIFAVKALGVSDTRILFRHLIPNVSDAIFINLTLLIPQIIFMEIFLGYIGLGVATNYVSLGTITSDAVATWRQFPLQIFFPSVVTCIIIFNFYVISDALRKSLNYRAKV